MILLAIGITCITKVRRGTSFAIVFGWWFLFVVVSVVLAAVTS
jgi:hypothetical protein